MGEIQARYGRDVGEMARLVLGDAAEVREARVRRRLAAQDRLRLHGDRVKVRVRVRARVRVRVRVMVRVRVRDGVRKAVSRWATYPASRAAASVWRPVVTTNVTPACFASPRALALRHSSPRRAHSASEKCGLPSATSCTCRTDGPMLGAWHLLLGLGLLLLE